jgi:hypothetical protein
MRLNLTVIKQENKKKFSDDSQLAVSRKDFSDRKLDLNGNLYPHPAAIPLCETQQEA